MQAAAFTRTVRWESVKSAVSEEEERFLQQIFARLGLSARGCHKILKVARTLADLEGKEQIERTHLREAAGYRDLQERYWGKEETDGGQA